MVGNCSFGRGRTARIALSTSFRLPFYILSWLLDTCVQGYIQFYSCSNGSYQCLKGSVFCIFITFQTGTGTNTARDSVFEVGALP